MKIFSPQTALVHGTSHIEMLYPFWGEPHPNKDDITSGRYDAYIQNGTQWHTLTDNLQDADVAVFPTKWEQIKENPEKALPFMQMAKGSQTPIVIFFWDDSSQPISYNDVYVFRTSTYKSQYEDKVFAMPAWSEDFVIKYFGGELLLRSKRREPIVGFCGAAKPLAKAHGTKWKYRLKEWTRSPKAKSGIELRSQALRFMDDNPRIISNFIIRQGFWGGAHDAKDGLDKEKAKKVRKEYVSNMVNSDYVLCVRGVGNYSYRLYETLCTGRIPIFIDTDCLLPYEHVIDWKEYVVWIDQSELHKIDKILLDFHNKLSPDEFRDLQIACRQLWLDWLSPQGFFKNFHRHFESQR